VPDYPLIPPYRRNDDQSAVNLPLAKPARGNGASASSHDVHELSALPPIPPPLPSLRPNTDECDSDGEQGWWADDGRTEISAWLVSFFVHAAVILLFGLITLSVRHGGTVLNLLAAAGDGDSSPAEIDRQSFAAEPNVKQGDATLKDSPDDTVPVEVNIEMSKIVPSADIPTKISNNLPSAPGNAAQSSDMARNNIKGPTGGGFEGRNPTARAGMIGQGGGTKKSELAVERGLRWLAEHQHDDGSWSFDLEGPPCNGMCRNSRGGHESSTTAATGLALLPFLGAGYTHLEGEHQEVVKKGLYYLRGRALAASKRGVDLRDGSTMYCHGIATVALCEAYGMTNDASLKEVAQKAIRFIVYAQDTKGGGWRYVPGMPGDTTVSGWQLMALKSGQMARLEVPTPSISLAVRFLDSVQYEKGARYGYLGPQEREKTKEATTAVGLLCRMYTGWHRDRSALYQGVKYLHRWGPSETNMYYDYYATQVLHHWQGPEWLAWNKIMRDYLIATQSMMSHEAGSWNFPDSYGDRGGRLYNTAMAIMILEVYYRHMPLYGDKAVNRRF
jgi:hypothetical protein